MPAARAAPGRDEQGGAEAASIELPDELRARAAVPLVGRRRELGELSKLWDAGRRRRPARRPDRRDRGRRRDRQDQPRRRARAAGPRRRRRGARRALAGGGGGALPAVPRSAQALRRDRARRRAAQDDPRLRPGARPAGARAEPPARTAAAADRGAGVRALPAVRGGRRPVRGDLRERPDPARARRLALGRPPDAAAAPPPRALARAQPPADPRRLPDRGDRSAARRRARGPEARAPADPDRRRRPQPARDRRAGPDADRRGSFSGAGPGAAPRDGGKPVLHRGDRAQPRGAGGRRRRGGRQRATAGRAARGRQTDDRAQDSPARAKDDRVAAGRGGDRARLRRRAARAAARVSTRRSFCGRWRRRSPPGCCSSRPASRGATASRTP